MSRPMATPRVFGRDLKGARRFPETLEQMDDRVERGVRISLDWIAVVVAASVLLGALIGIHVAEREQARATAAEILDR